MISEVKTDKHIERRIIIGMIVSTDYLSRIRKLWNPQFFTSEAARILSTWCIEYFDKYGKAPQNDIDDIFCDKVNNNKIPEDVAELFNDILLPSLAKENEHLDKFNSGYLYDQTLSYFKAQELRLYTKQIQELIDQGRADEAEELAQNYRPTVLDELNVGLELSSDEALERVEIAFNKELERLISYPDDLGDMLNDHLIRGGFVGFMGPEKRGKTAWLLELAMRAIMQKCNVVFFQAGDMTETQQLKRICIYLAERSDNPKYCKEGYRPVVDCVYNQLNLCDHEDRTCDFGVLRNFTPDDLYAHIDYDTLIKAVEDNPDYIPCKACSRFKGSIWYVKEKEKMPLTAEDAKRYLKRFFDKYKQRFKLATYAADTLSVDEIRNCLKLWEQYDNFVPDVILVDYADLLTAPVKEFRHKQDYIWKNLRGLSQEKHALVITATQSDADSYDTDLLKLSNFSEDKRKYSHVTAMFGLNQDKDGHEKKLGVLRLNELVIREGEFSSSNEIVVLQYLRGGRAYVGSFRKA